jgi:hypothetical protein
MKSKEDIHIAIAGLTMIVHEHVEEMTELELGIARTGLSLLCWVMDYPTNFNETFEALKEQFGKDKFKADELEAIIKETLVEVKEERDKRKQDGGHCE